MASIADTLANAAVEDSAGTAPGQRNDYKAEG
jgi:hypothetical protein